MTYFTAELYKIMLFFISSTILTLLLFCLVYVVSYNSRIDGEKSSAYESGFNPFQEVHFPFSVQFSLIGVIFLLFDIEVLYLYPLVSSICDFNIYALYALWIFFMVLVVGIVYEISRQVMSMGSSK